MSILDQAKQFLQQNGIGIGNQNPSVLGIDIGSSSIKIVQLRKDKGAAVLETYGEISLGPLAEQEVGQATNLPVEKLATALKDLMRESEVTTKNCGVSVPFAASLIRLIEVPALDAQKMATVIPIEARKYIPVPINEVQLDWFIVPETEQRLFEGAKEPTSEHENQEGPKKRLVLIVAMHKETLRKYTDVLKQVNLSPSFYEIEVFSNIRSTISRSLAPVAIIDLGAATSKLYLVELGIVMASHVIQAGSQDITRALASSTHISMTKAEDLKRQTGILSVGSSDDAVRVSHAATLTMEHIFAEARRVLLGFQRKYNKVITKVILTGGGSTLKGLQDFAREQLELEVEVADPFTQIQAPAFLETVLKQAGPDFAVALGLALRKLQESGQ
jgi:type IV pilus assembly protein PilM